MGDITRYRGDTVPDQFTIKNPDGTLMNVTGCTFKLTVSREKDPVDTSPQLFQVAGVITNAALGQIEFRPTVDDADQEPGGYFYDVQMVDASTFKRTVEKAKYKFVQDITKD